MRVCEVMVDLALDKAAGAGGWCGGGVMAGIFCDDLGWCGWLWCCLLSNIFIAAVTSN